MLNQEDIHFFLNVFKTVDPDVLLGLFAKAQIKTLAAGDIYIREGSRSEKIGYIRNGLMRAYSVKPNGNDITLFLRWENHLLASHDTIICKQPSRFTYEAVEDTVLTELDYAIVEQNPALANVSNNLLLYMLAQTIRRVESFVLLSPEERYLQLVSEKPDIVNRVPGKYLATMLGITPVSLSRIRKRIASKNEGN